jgi:tetratricopeptide (TPR) repeat protein
VTDRLLSCEDHTIVVGGRHEANLTGDSFIGTEIRIANEIVQQVLAGLPKDSQPQHRVDPRAYEAYLKGRYLWAQRTTQSLTQAMTFFQKAIEYDDKYAPSYAGLADCYALLGSAPNTGLPPSEAFPKAEANARKALDLDPGLAEAHVSMGYSELVYERSYANSRNEFQTALNLRPNYATAHQYYAYYLTSMRSLNEAIQERKRAVELEPASPLLNAALGEAYYQAHQFDLSMAHNREALSLDPHYAVAVINVGLSLEQKQMYSDALHAFQSILQFAPNDPALLAFVGHNYAVSGQTASAQQVVAQLKQMKESSYVSSLYIALVYTGLGNKDEAFAWLDKAYNERCEYLVYLPTEPLADSLRGDPRFDALLKNLGLTN